MSLDWWVGPVVSVGYTDKIYSTLKRKFKLNLLWMADDVNHKRGSAISRRFCSGKNHWLVITVTSLDAQDKTTIHKLTIMKHASLGHTEEDEFGLCMAAERKLLFGPLFSHFNFWLFIYWFGNSNLLDCLILDYMELPILVNLYNWITKIQFLSLAMAIVAAADSTIPT